MGPKNQFQTRKNFYRKTFQNFRFWDDEKGLTSSESTTVQGQGKNFIMKRIYIEWNAKKNIFFNLRIFFKFYTLENLTQLSV